jgi:1,4-dihydroxy-2-naphthoate octaprenyltransferase
MTNYKAWINAMRLRTLPLSLSGIILGSGIAFHHGYWNSTIFVLAMITTILLQVLSNFANDLGDGIKGTDNSHRLGPVRAVQSGDISKKKMKIAVVLMSLLSLTSATALIYFGTKNMPANIILTYVGLALACVVAAITYTIGKKAYGYHGMGDLMVLIFFGGVSVLGVFSLYTKQFFWENIHLSVFVGLLSTAVLNLNNMRDYKNDAASGKKTLVVMMGPNMAKFYHLFLVLIGLIALIIFINKLNDEIYYFALLPGVLLLLHLRKVMKIKFSKDFDPELKKVALSTFGISLVLFCLLIWY